ncbi:hypothetical protein RCF98_06950 [Thiothrix lacustris]|uniref:Sulfur globule protein CV1 n=1 Tax=Thiothrix lacustris TaxID=525917 RepID=A0ABY9MTS3_9GAMM|nr:hypothetical protein [Thiothrix lacustris]WML92074.1 hypothetical protein RCF98_06950 [Thiothrix lacustris]
MNARITVFTALALLAGNAFADFFDGFDMGNFFGNNRQEQARQASTAGQTYGNGASNGQGHSRGRGEADINMDFDLNFRAKGFTMLDGNSRAQSRGDVAQYQNRQFNAYGTGYNTANSWVNASPYGYAYPYSYYPYYTPYAQQPYPQAYQLQQYYPQAYYLPPAR